MPCTARGCGSGGTISSPSATCRCVPTSCSRDKASPSSSTGVSGIAARNTATSRGRTRGTGHRSSRGTCDATSACQRRWSTPGGRSCASGSTSRRPSLPSPWRRQSDVEVRGPLRLAVGARLEVLEPDEHPPRELPQGHRQCKTRPQEDLPQRVRDQGNQGHLHAVRLPLCKTETGWVEISGARMQHDDHATTDPVTAETGRELQDLCVAGWSLLHLGGKGRAGGVERDHVTGPRHAGVVDAPGADVVENEVEGGGHERLPAPATLRVDPDESLRHHCRLREPEHAFSCGGRQSCERSEGRGRPWRAISRSSPGGRSRPEGKCVRLTVRRLRQQRRAQHRREGAAGGSPDAFGALNPLDREVGVRPRDHQGTHECLPRRTLVDPHAHGRQRTAATSAATFRASSGGTELPSWACTD